MRLDAFHLLAVVVYGLIGMGLGIAMAASGDHTLSPAHAHLNLMGWVSAVLYGLVLRAWPGMAAGRIAIIHALLAHLGVALLVPGVVLVHLQVPGGTALAAAGAVLAFAGMAIFAAMAFRAMRRKAALRSVAA